MKMLWGIILVGIIVLSACDRKEASVGVEPASKQAAAAQSDVPGTSESNAALVARAGAPLFDGLGTHTHPITTEDSGAQRYFDQGLVLAFAFNHAEAVRSFRAAQRLDDNCAMCFWGEALATGPNINITSKGKVIMAAEARASAYEALQKAVSRKDKVSPREQDYIDALTARYNGDPATDREPLDQAYADAMRGLANKYPEDVDANALFAEALMNTMPWNYWSEKGEAKPATREVLQMLEAALVQNAEHPLAIHLYIHATEASSAPEKAEAAADTLAHLIPGAGHLVHMPAHTYWRVGRYNDAAEANVRAAAVDENYIAQCNAQGFYPALYYPHNIHFLWSASSMEGRSAVAIEAARKLVTRVSVEQVRQFPVVEFFRTVPLQALAQFAHWDEILAEPQPLDEFDLSNGIWHYARGLALLASDQVELAKQQRDALVERKSAASIALLDTNDYPASQVLEIADQLLLGEIAMHSDDADKSIEYFTQAVALQDALPYTEPPFWYYPTRQSLGLALLRAGRPEQAETVYREDLQQFPRNGWSTFGLMQSLRAQGKDSAADEALKAFEVIWQLADVKLTASRL
ncbi:MAG: hypothetical protein V7721_01310 [Porticoccaceae bacterium]